MLVKSRPQSQKDKGVFPRNFDLGIVEREERGTTYQLRDDATDARLTRERELALFQNLRSALLVGVFHGDDDLGVGRVGDEVHGAAEAFDFAGQHPFCVTRKEI